MALDIPADDGLAGKVAIVTGAGAQEDGIGNGRAAAVLLAAAGARVLCVDRDVGLAERTVAMIGEAGGTAHALEADVTVAGDCEATVDAALSRWGRLDVLDNNVGIGSRGNVVEEEPERWRRVMEVNVDSMFHASRAAVPAMREAGGGAIVNVSSISALRPRGLTTYSVSKSAVIGLTRQLAIDYAAHGIRVNAVAPGFVETSLSRPVMGDNPEHDLTPWPRLGTVSDVASAVAFLASDESEWMTGSVLAIDGGYTAR